MTQVLPAPPVQSAYLEQVRQIAPEELRGGEEELAELAAFCAGRGQSPYVWWRAPHSAGKSALMSWFVLHPPPGVHVVSFSITSRYRGRDKPGAFTDAMLEQLAALMGKQMPSYQVESVREHHLLGLLAEAARANRRLVLVVDGLDEDQGVTTGPDACSIAALLQARARAR